MPYARIINGIVVERVLEPSEGLVEVGEDVICGMVSVSGVFVNPPPAPVSYVGLRRSAYPPIGEQLDMLYKDKLNGTTLFQDEITRIKNLYPKPV